MITGFFFYLTAFITVFLMVVSIGVFFDMIALAERNKEALVISIGAASIFSASTVFFIFGLLL